MFYCVDSAQSFVKNFLGNLTRTTNLYAEYNAGTLGTIVNKL